MTLIKIVIKQMLPAATIIEAGNGKIAVELFTQDHPDLILMDVQMPEMNGYDAVGRLGRLKAAWRPKGEGLVGQGAEHR